jgi:hypothetical protein
MKVWIRVTVYLLLAWLGFSWLEYDAPYHPAPAPQAVAKPCTFSGTWNVVKPGQAGDPDGIGPSQTIIDLSRYEQLMREERELKQARGKLWISETTRRYAEWMRVSTASGCLHGDDPAAPTSVRPWYSDKVHKHLPAGVKPKDDHTSCLVDPSLEPLISPHDQCPELLPPSTACLVPPSPAELLEGALTVRITLRDHVYSFQPVEPADQTAYRARLPFCGPIE